VPLNYQVMYAVGWLFALLSSYWVTKIRVPDSFVPAPQPRQPLHLRKMLGQARQAMSEHHDFVRMTFNTLLHGTGLWMIGPLYILYYVRQLGATDGWIGLNGTLGNLTPIFGYMLWQRLIRSWGENKILKWTIVLNGVYPIVVGLTPLLSVIPILTAVQGLLIGPAVNLTHFPMLLKVCPDVKRPQYIAVYSTIMNISAFIMPLIGVWLAGIFGFGPVIVAGGVMTILGSSSFFWNHLRTPDSLSVRRHDAEAG
jgi:MFS family permease